MKGKEPWEIPNGFLITLCEDCHTAGSCPTDLGYKSCKECPDFFENKPELGCDGSVKTNDIALLLGALWKKGYDLHDDLGPLTDAIMEAEKPDVFPIECKLLIRKWEPSKELLEKLEKQKKEKAESAKQGNQK